MSKQTAVEWLIEELHKASQGESDLTYNQAFDKARLMEKEQKAEAWEKGYKKGERIGSLSMKGNMLIVDPINPYK